MLMGENMQRNVSWPIAVLCRRRPGPATHGLLARYRILMHALLVALVNRPSLTQSNPKLSASSTGIAPSPVSPGPRAHVDDLYARYARALLGYLYHRLPSLADAEDALAEVYLAALRTANRGEMPGPGWLMTVSRRQIARFYRERH